MLTNQVNILWMRIKKKENFNERPTKLKDTVEKDPDRLSNKNNSALLLEFPPYLKGSHQSDHMFLLICRYLSI